MEPVATSAGLWSWFEPGLFRVPPIVPFGWAVFAASSSWSCWRIRHQTPTLIDCFRLILLPVITAHGVLLIIWWGVFRWVNSTIHPIYGVVLAWTVAIYVVIRILQRKTGKRLERKTLLLRLPGALFFFGLVVLKSHGDPWLTLYALAFAPPYLALMSQQYKMWSVDDGT
jgi:hypothetical protein